ncbi:MAG: hypothetical protein JW751_08350 [Polyangiaceae bacterium]|nr:hypothetical protein [Polyangiaceae bacterium]
MNRLSRYRLRFLHLALFVLLPGMGTGYAWEARAEEAAPADQTAEEVRPERPWAAGVSEEAQNRALAHFRAGNSFLSEGFLPKAIAEYRSALEHWNHPGIHYNLALALIALNRPGETIETYRHLEAALRYDSGALDVENGAHAQKYLGLVEQQLATVVVTCEESEAVVRLDGQLLFRAPGRYEGIVLRGEHVLTAAKPGFETTQVTVDLAPGPPNTLGIKLYRPEELVGHRRQWPLWGPVTLTAAGVAVLAAGPILTIQANDRFEDHDEWLSARSDCQTGCQPDDDLSRLEKTGKQLQILGAVAYVAGGTATATGLGLMYHNRKRPFRIEPRVLERGAVAVAPALSFESVGVVARGRF